MTDNELIAEFMGYHVYDRELFGKTVRVFSVKTDDSVDRALSEHYVGTLSYHKSWDSLVPVVVRLFEKLSDIKRPLESYEYSNLLRGAIEMSIWDYLYGRATMKDVCDELVNAIKWYKQLES